MNIRALTSNQILAIPSDSPHKLFSSENASYEMKILRGLWHPDLNVDPQAKAVFQHIYDLYAEAERQLASGSWKGASKFTWRGKDSTLQLSYLNAAEFELGVQYTSSKQVVWAVAPEHSSLFSSALRTLSSLSYAGPDMKAQFEKLFPTNIKHWDGEKLVIMSDKTEDVFPLRLVLNKFGGALPPKHVAWVVSRLQNIAAYLEFVGLSHHAISIDNLFISPKYHTVLLLGGWWYAQPLGRRVSQVPGALKHLYPKELLTTKEATVKTDQALIKAVSLELLGDTSSTGSMLLSRIGPDDIPMPMLSFLRSPPMDSAEKAFVAWSEALESSFGKRKFVELKLTASDLFE